MKFKRTPHYYTMLEIAREYITTPELVGDRLIREVWKSLYEQGIHPSAIGKRFDVHGRTVQAHLNDYGVAMRSRGGANNHTGKGFLLFIEGIPLKHWARQHGIQYSTALMQYYRGALRGVERKERTR